MNLTYTDIDDMVAAGDSAASIASQLNATGVTNKPINRADLVFLLNMRGMLTKLISNNSDEKWTGTVLAMQSAIVAAGADDGPIRQWLSHITNPTNTIWDTTQADYSAPFKAMVDTFADQPGMPTSEDFQAVVDLGGGYKFSGVDAAAVQAVIDLQAKKDAFDTAIAAEQALAAPHNVAVSRLQSLKNQDTYALSLAEIEAEIATVREYPETYPAEGGE